jgi:hypothetical protein
LVSHRRIALEVVGAQRRVDDVDVSAKDAIVVEARHAGKCSLDLRVKLAEFLDAGLFCQFGVERIVEEAEHVGGDPGILIQRRCDVVLRVGDARLPEIAGISAQNAWFRARTVLQKDQPVEAVIVDRTVEGGDEGFFQRRAVSFEIDDAAAADFESCRAARQLRCGRGQRHIDIECSLADDVEAEIFQQRHAA